MHYPFNLALAILSDLLLYTWFHLNLELVFSFLFRYLNTKLITSHCDYRFCLK